jgi:hypothetical protein
MRNTILATIAVLIAVAAKGFADERFERVIRPLLRDYCVACHSSEKQEGELDLQRFASLEQIEWQPKVWAHVKEQLSLGEMPPKDAKQLSVEQKLQLANWVRSMLDEIALANAGDPGPVVLRRLITLANQNANSSGKSHDLKLTLRKIPQHADRRDH